MVCALQALPFLKSDACTLTAECFNEWIFAGFKRWEWTIEMDSNLWLWRCQLIPGKNFLLQVVAPRFSWGKKNKKVHFGCHILLKWWGTESIEKCWRLSCLTWQPVHAFIPLSRVIPWSETAPAAFQRKWVSWPDLHLHASALCTGAQQVICVSDRFLLTNQDCCG